MRPLTFLLIALGLALAACGGEDHHRFEEPPPTLEECQTGTQLCISGCAQEDAICLAECRLFSADCASSARAYDACAGGADCVEQWRGDWGK